MPNSPIRPKDRFLVFGAPAIEDAKIQEVVATFAGQGRTVRLAYR